MLTPYYLAALPNRFVDLWAGVESDIVAQIARRLVRTKMTVGAASQWQIEKLQEMRYTRSKVVKELARATEKSNAEIRRALVEAGTVGLKYDDALYRKAGKTVIDMAHSEALRDVLQAGIMKTKGLCENFTRTTADTAQTAFYNAMDEAWIKMMSGAYSPQQAITASVEKLAASGMEKVAYPTGHTDRLEVAARRAILTGANQTTAQLQIARMDEMECDLVEVTAHSGARPTHAVWQGQIYSRSGKHRHYKDFYASTGYGDGDGLCGWNCYHNFYPFFEGVSEPTFGRDDQDYYEKDLRENNAQYERQQEQRALERKIRESKRECAALDAAMQDAADPETKRMLREKFDKASLKLKKRKSEMTDFLDRTHRGRQEEREWVQGFSRSTAQKAVQGAKRAAAK